MFKWTPEFDPFFESPIAPIWCNLVGLPIHLFEKSTLFAIGGLPGTPIQVDYATFSKKRLSFARICIEIDISKAPLEEIVIDIQGREFYQKVIWDRIPHYCQVCRHVGHSREACYANGNKEKPTRRDYNTPYVKRQQTDVKARENNGKQKEMEVEQVDIQTSMVIPVTVSSLGTEVMAGKLENQRPSQVTKGGVPGSDLFEDGFKTF